MLTPEEPTDYAHETTGKVLGLEYGTKRMVAGRFRLFYLDLEAAVNDDMAVFDVFDSRATTLDYFYEMFDADET